MRNDKAYRGVTEKSLVLTDDGMCDGPQRGLENSTSCTLGAPGQAMYRRVGVREADTLSSLKKT